MRLASFKNRITLWFLSTSNLCITVAHLTVLFGGQQVLLKEKATHLTQVGLKRLVLRPLLRKLSLGLGTLVLDILLASILLPSEHDGDEREHERDYE